MKWEDNILNQVIINQVGCLENKDNYVSINTSLNETALRVKFKDTDKKIDNYKTFIVMGNHKETIDAMNSDLDILNWFVENANGFWTDHVGLLEDYISDNFII